LDAAVEAQSRPYFHDACSEAMGRWLPTFGPSNEWWDHATHIDKRDGFVYGNERPSSPEFLGDQGPDDGARFVYGTAGPPKGRAVYDSIHRIAFYQQGCCGWHDVVAAAGAPAPPKPLPSRELQNLATVRGVRLWETEAEVIATYGKSTPEPVPRHRGVSVLSYTTWPPRKSVTYVHMPCGQFQNFFFRSDRLILIQFGNGC
jgi:hypothetical protein